MSVTQGPPGDVLAAGAVVLRKRRGGQVLLVHRPRYDDWSFPKGKLDPGEHVVAAAVREVAEETGLEVRLGPPLTGQRYPVNDRMKSVAYWIGRVRGSHDLSAYEPNDEIDDLAWVGLDEAMARLTYVYDQATLLEARGVQARTRALVVVRHGEARSRKGWEGDDRLRPLAAEGRSQAKALPPLLAAYGVTRVVTSSSVRCVQTVAPYADQSGWSLEEHDGLSEEDATAESVLEIVDTLVTSDDDAALCTHRPVLPSVFDALGVQVDDKLAPGELVVVHHRDGVVVATERLRP